MDDCKGLGEAMARSGQEDRISRLERRVAALEEESKKIGQESPWRPTRYWTQNGKAIHST